MTSANDAYDVLGINADASDDDIKAKYRQLAEIFHPDRFAEARPSVRAEALTRMSELNNAMAEITRQRTRDTARTRTEPGATSAGPPIVVSTPVPHSVSAGVAWRYTTHATGEVSIDTPLTAAALQQRLTTALQRHARRISEQPVTGAVTASIRWKTFVFPTSFAVTALLDGSRLRATHGRHWSWVGTPGDKVNHAFDEAVRPSGRDIGIPNAI